MASYRVKVCQIWTGFVTVEANNKDEAEQKAEAIHDNDPDSVEGEITELAFDAEEQA